MKKKHVLGITGNSARADFERIFFQYFILHTWYHPSRSMARLFFGQNQGKIRDDFFPGK